MTDTPSFHQILLDRKVPNAAQSASVACYLTILLAGTAAINDDGDFSRGEVNTVGEAWLPIIRETLTDAQRLGKITNRVGVTAALFAVFKRINPIAYATFYDRLHTGENTTGETDPCLILRNRLIRIKKEGALFTERPLYTRLFIKAWNAHVLGKPLSLLQTSAYDEIPDIQGWSTWDEIESMQDMMIITRARDLYFNDTFPMESMRDAVLRELGTCDNTCIGTLSSYITRAPIDVTCEVVRSLVADGLVERKWGADGLVRATFVGLVAQAAP